MTNDVLCVLAQMKQQHATERHRPIAETWSEKNEATVNLFEVFLIMILTIGTNPKANRKAYKHSFLFKRCQ